MNFIHSALRASVALAALLAAGARADTVFFDNTDVAIANTSFVSAAVSQNVRIKTDAFTPGDSLASIDIWLGLFTAPDGMLPSLNLYADNSGSLGGLVASAQLTSAPASSSVPQQVHVDFANGPVIQDETFYWLGMSFAPGSSGTLGWATSLDSQMTFLAFITAAGTNYVGTFNVPHVKLNGTAAAAVPEGGSIALYLGTLAAGMALYRRQRRDLVRA